MVAAEALAFDTRWQRLCLVRALCPLMGAGQGAQEPPANPQGSPFSLLDLEPPSSPYLDSQAPGPRSPSLLLPLSWSLTLSTWRLRGEPQPWAWRSPSPDPRGPPGSRSSYLCG